MDPLIVKEAAATGFAATGFAANEFAAAEFAANEFAAAEFAAAEFAPNSLHVKIGDGVEAAPVAESPADVTFEFEISLAIHHDGSGHLRTGFCVAKL